MWKRMVRIANTASLVLANHGRYNMNMCSNCGNNPPYIGTMCRSCAGVS